MTWLGAFVAGLFLIALPAAFFARSEAAAAIFLAWAIGQLTYTAGLPEAPAQTMIYGVAFFALCVRIILAPGKWSWQSVSIAILFLPLASVSALWWRGAPEPYWPIYWTGVVQMGLLVRPIIWARTVRSAIVRFRSGHDEHFSMVAQ